jgi:putative Ca2+/H+ antiporter (TMEM165/GDT1 family)
VGRDRTTLWGVLGIVLGLICCGVLGVIFGYLSIRDARRNNRSPLLGYLAIAFGVINIIGGGILRATGNYPFWNND